MSSQKGTSSSSGAGMNKGGGMSPVQSAAVTGTADYAGLSVQQGQTEAGKKYVKEKLGLTEKKAGPMDYLQDETTGVTASNLSQTKGGSDFYGTEASQATNEYLVSIGEANVGNYFVQEGGNYIRVNKQAYESAKKSGKNVSKSYILTSKGRQMKYGRSKGAMGSGDSSSIMGSIPISEPMFEAQRKMQKQIGLGMSALGIPFAGALAYGSAVSKQYGNYLNNFKTKQGMSAVAISSAVERGDKTNTTTRAVEDASGGDLVYDTHQNKEQRNKNLLALSKATGTQAEGRSFLVAKGRTFGGTMKV